MYRECCGLVKPCVSIYFTSGRAAAATCCWSPPRNILQCTFIYTRSQLMKNHASIYLSRFVVLCLCIFIVLPLCLGDVSVSAQLYTEHISWASSLRLVCRFFFLSLSRRSILYAPCATRSSQEERKKHVWCTDKMFRRRKHWAKLHEQFFIATFLFWGGSKYANVYCHAPFFHSTYHFVW